MNIETGAIKGHFGFDSKRVLRVSIENKFEIELAIEHDDHTTFIALDRNEAVDVVGGSSPTVSCTETRTLGRAKCRESHHDEGVTRNRTRA